MEVQLSSCKGDACTLKEFRDVVENGGFASTREWCEACENTQSPLCVTAAVEAATAAAQMKANSPSQNDLGATVLALVVGAFLGGLMTALATIIAQKLKKRGSPRSYRSASHADDEDELEVQMDDI